MGFFHYLEHVLSQTFFTGLMKVQIANIKCSSAYHSCVSNCHVDHNFVCQVTPCIRIKNSVKNSFLRVSLSPSALLTYPKSIIELIPKKYFIWNFPFMEILIFSGDCSLFSCKSFFMCECKRKWFRLLI